MASLIGFLIVVLVVYGLYKWLTRPKYRVRLTDPVTGYAKYLLSVDGINNSFEYTSSSQSALIFTEASRAERFASTISRDARPEIQVKKLLGWQSINRG